MKEMINLKTARWQRMKRSKQEKKESLAEWMNRRNMKGRHFERTLEKKLTLGRKEI